MSACGQFRVIQAIGFQPRAESKWKMAPNRRPPIQERERIARANPGKVETLFRPDLRQNKDLEQVSDSMNRENALVPVDGRGKRRKPPFAARRHRNREIP
jgi:hypothetical protein